LGRIGEISHVGVGSEQLVLQQQRHFIGPRRDRESCDQVGFIVVADDVQARQTGIGIDACDPFGMVVIPVHRRFLGVQVAVAQAVVA
jgi:hypothetical protein